MKRWLVPFGFLVAGLLVSFWRPLTSGFAFLPRDSADTRLLHYFLEHSYLWVTRTPPHLAFWDAPFFYPAANVMAYSDLLVGSAFPYWGFRPWFAPPVCFGLWILASSALNFGAFYLLLRRPLRLGVLASSVGAYLFSFAHLRLTQLGHFQLLPQYYVVVAVYALFRLTEEDAVASPPRFRRWLALFCAAGVLQLYSGFYFAWYLAFTLSVLLAYCLGVKKYRALLFSAGKRYRGSLVALSGISLILLAPLLWHYVQQASTAGYRGFGNMRDSLVPLRAWFYFGNENWFYYRLNGISFFDPVTGNIEKRLGLGFFTVGLAGWALWARRRETVVKGALLFAIGVVAATSRLPGSVELWRLPYFFYPGAKAISAVPRFSFFLLMVLAWGLALAVERARVRGGVAGVAIGLLVFLALAEQGATVAVYDVGKVTRQVDEIARLIPADCSSFLLTPTADSPGSPDSLLYHMDAMWAGVQRRLPTVNGYSGSAPLAYPLLEFFQRGRRSEDLPVKLEAWRLRGGLTVPPCRVEFRGRLDAQGQ